MTQRQSFSVLVVAAIVALAIVASATVLVALHDLDAAAYATLVGSAMTATGLGGIQLGQKALNGGPTVDLERLARTSPEVAAQFAAGGGMPSYPSAAQPSGDPPQSPPAP